MQAVVKVIEARRLGHGEHRDQRGGKHIRARRRHAGRDAGAAAGRVAVPTVCGAVLSSPSITISASSIPSFTSCPSVYPTVSNCPSTRDRTVTVFNAVTVPNAFR